MCVCHVHVTAVYAGGEAGTFGGRGWPDESRELLLPVLSPSRLEAACAVLVDTGACGMGCTHAGQLSVEACACSFSVSSRYGSLCTSDACCSEAPAQGMAWHGRIACTREPGPDLRS